MKLYNELSGFLRSREEYPVLLKVICALFSEKIYVFRIGYHYFTKFLVSRSIKFSEAYEP